MKQLKLKLDTKEKPPTPTEVFWMIGKRYGTRSFFNWLKAREQKAYLKGFEDGQAGGYAEGFRAGKSSRIPDNY